jgi:hypothetical protein
MSFSGIWFGMEMIDFRKLQMAAIILEAVVDRLTDLEDRSTEEEFEHQDNIVEIDGTIPHSAYCRDCDLCEGMDW